MTIATMIRGITIILFGTTRTWISSKIFGLEFGAYSCGLLVLGGRINIDDTTTIGSRNQPMVLIFCTDLLSEGTAHRFHSNRGTTMQNGVFGLMIQAQKIKIIHSIKLKVEEGSFAKKIEIKKFLYLKKVLMKLYNGSKEIFQLLWNL